MHTYEDVLHVAKTIYSIDSERIGCGFADWRT